MTFKEMDDNVIQPYCREHRCLNEPKNCAIEEICRSVDGDFENNPVECAKAYEVITNGTTNDIINHPSHYCRDGGMESIDEMVLVFGKEAVKNFCLCNVWKYRYRSSTKNGEEDLKKSDWYMRKYKELSNE
jgi:hypothetical protein